MQMLIMESCLMGLGVLCCLVNLRGSAWPVLCYCLVPLALLTIHIIFNYLQEIEVGPIWAQNHLHNLGLPGYFVPGVLVGSALYGWVCALTKQPVSRRRHAEDTVSATPIYAALGTVGAIVYEIVEVILIRLGYIEQGNYSGQLDWFDLSAYVIGFALIVANHRLLKSWVLRRIQARQQVPSANRA